jgi:hypothetical protein
MRPPKIITARSDGNQFIALQHTAPRIQFGVDFWLGWAGLHSTPSGFPGFPVLLSGLGALHAVFLKENRTPGRVQGSVQEIRGYPAGATSVDGLLK